jgi:hypothetical protein
MGYIDIFIPLIIGLLLTTSPQIFLKQEDPQFEKKKSTFQKAGYVLVGVAILYSLIKFLS